jgi:hypothetical protein
MFRHNLLFERNMHHVHNLLAIHRLPVGFSVHAATSQSRVNAFQNRITCLPSISRLQATPISHRFSPVIVPHPYPRYCHVVAVRFHDTFQKEGISSVRFCSRITSWSPFWSGRPRCIYDVRGFAGTSVAVLTNYDLRVEENKAFVMRLVMIAQNKPLSPCLMTCTEADLLTSNVLTRQESVASLTLTNATHHDVSTGDVRNIIFAIHVSGCCTVFLY